jgi:transposase
MQITTIGLDIAKHVFQVHGIDAAEKVIVRKQLRRSQVLAFFKALPPCLVGMEACASAHYWARELNGTLRHFAVTQQFCRFQDEADMNRIYE